MPLFKYILSVLNMLLSIYLSICASIPSTMPLPYLPTTPDPPICPAALRSIDLTASGRRGNHVINGQRLLFGAETGLDKSRCHTKTFKHVIISSITWRMKGGNTKGRGINRFLPPLRFSTDTASILVPSSLSVSTNVKSYYCSMGRTECYEGQTH